MSSENYNTKQIPLRSFGRVRGRKLRPSKQTLMEALLPKITFKLPPPGRGRIEVGVSSHMQDGYSVQDATPTPPSPFQGEEYSEWWLEIGCGAGEHAAFQAEANPNVGYIACEPYVNGLSHLLQKIHDKDLKNVRIYAGDAREVIAGLPEAALSRVFILFPDPWPKVRHWKRRLLTTEFFNALTVKMKPNAPLRLATDHVDYLGWMLSHALASPALKWLAKRHTDWDEQPKDAIVTRYQAKARVQGRVATYLDFARI